MEAADLAVAAAAAVATTGSFDLLIPVGADHLTGYAGEAALRRKVWVPTGVIAAWVPNPVGGCEPHK